MRTNGNNCHNITDIPTTSHLSHKKPSVTTSIICSPVQLQSLLLLTRLCLCKIELVRMWMFDAWGRLSAIVQSVKFAWLI